MIYVLDSVLVYNTSCSSKFKTIKLDIVWNIWVQDSHMSTSIKQQTWYIAIIFFN